MSRRLLVLLLSASLLAIATPSEAVYAFGPAYRVAADGCVNAKLATDSAGASRGFVSCYQHGSGSVYWLGSTSQPSRWVRSNTGLQGDVVAVAEDGTATYGLVRQEPTLTLVVRTRSGRVTTKVLTRYVTRYTEAQVVAAGGKWWAIWPEYHTATGERLYDARTLVGTRGRAVVHAGATSRSLEQQRPSLTLRPGGGVTLVYLERRCDGCGALWVGQNSGQGWSARRLLSGMDAPRIITVGRSYYLAYMQSMAKCPCVVRLRQYSNSRWGAERVVSTALSQSTPHPAVSGGVVFLAWNRPVTNGPRPFVAQRTNGRWTAVTFNVSNEWVDGIGAAGGRAKLFTTRVAGGYEVMRKQ